MNSKLNRIEKYAFAESGLTSIQVPASVEVLCEKCFFKCNSLPSVTFEEDSKLHRIEEYAFGESALTALLLPHSIHFVSSWALHCLSLNTISFDPGPCAFEVREMFIEDISGRSRVCYLGRLSVVVIESRIEVLC
jgi:hypothetical protein